MYSCVYAYCDPRKIYGKEHFGVLFQNEPFYIGKGTKMRVKHHLYPSSLYKGPSPKSAKILKILKCGFVEIPIKICREFDNDKDAYEWEQKFIKDIGRKDLNMGPLTNLTDGGEGQCAMADSVKIKRYSKKLGITEEEYLQHQKNKEKHCPACLSWKTEVEMMQHYCRICWNNRAKQQRAKKLIRLCNNNEEIVNFYKNFPTFHINAKKCKISLIDYYTIIQQRKRKCNSCGWIKPISEMFTECKCRNCCNKYSKNYSKKQRNYEGRLRIIQHIVGIKLAKAVLQSALRQHINPDEYARHVACGDRYCSACKRWLSMDSFWQKKNRVLGTQNRCNKCW